MTVPRIHVRYRRYQRLSKGEQAVVTLVAFLGGTNADNIRDAMSKGRMVFRTGDLNGTRRHPERRPRGERHGSARLTWDQVRSIRHRRAAGETLTALADAFDVSVGTISHICLGRTWIE